MFTQSGDCRTRDAAWRWLQENFEALVPKVPEFFEANATATMAKTVAAR